MRSLRPAPETPRLPDRRSSVPPRSGKRATLTLVTGLNLGQVFELEARESVIGRGSDAAVSLLDPDVSRKHARVIRAEDGRYIIEDLGSKNGVFVSGRRIGRVEIRPGERVSLGANVALRFDVMDFADHDLQRKLFDTSRRDPLTQAFSRGHFKERLVSDVSMARKRAADVSVLMIGIDALKNIDRTFGALAAEDAIREVAAEMTCMVSGEDIVARWGEGELALLVHGMTPTLARLFADRVRRAIEILPIDSAGDEISVTASIGLACLSELGRFARPLDMTNVAERRMNEARLHGRNRVCAGEET